MTIAGSKIIDNSAVSGGGGLRNLGGKMTIIVSTISHNSADVGGGIYSDSFNGGSLVIIVSTIRHNSAQTSPSNGGGIAFHGTAPVLLASSVTDNTGGDIVAV